MALDERLHRELERAARPADPNGVYEELIRRRERRRIARRMQTGALALVVFAGTIGGFYALTRVFRGNGEIATPGTSANGRLAFSLYSEPSTHRIALLDSDGAGIRFLTSGQALDTAPAWSPDGTKLVFWRSGADVPRGLWVMNADGTDARPLHETDASIRAIDWSPDGSSIAFVSIEIPDGPSTELDFSDDLYVMNANGTSATAVITEGQVIDFDWSPDGTQLVIERQLGVGGNRLGYDLAIVDADGGAERALTSNGLSRDPTWSPDGSSIVYVGSATGRFEDRDLFAIGPDGTGLVQLTNDAAAEEDPEFSPDGSLIAYERLPHADGSACELVLMQPDGAAARVIATKDELGGCPIGLAWQPLPQGELVSPVPTPTETPTESPSPAGGQDIGLGFPVCRVTSVSGVFAPGVEGIAYVATKMGDTGGCENEEGGFQVIAVDVTGDGLADTSYGPLECDVACSAYAAPDVDRDGIEEVAVTVGSTGGSTLFELYAVAGGATLQRLGYDCSHCNDGIFAWGGPGGHLEGAYCLPESADGDFVAWSAERTGARDQYALVEVVIDVKGRFLSEVGQRDSVVPFDPSALPPGGGSDFCGSPVAVSHSS